MTSLKGIICGRGGEGVITLNKTIGVIFTLNNFPVISSETHGMAQRGGSVVTFLKVGDYSSPAFLLKSADFFISTNYEEYINRENLVANHTIAIINNEDISHLEIRGKIYLLNAMKISLNNFKTGRFLNQVLAGFFLGIMQHNINNLTEGDIIKYKFINMDAVRLGFNESSKCVN
jgi:indolepyruvate ferredoxin oxidoreductase beta subunit